MIHYHGTPLGGESLLLPKFFAGRHALVSWRAPQDIAVIADCCSSFVLDNGAFSAHTHGEPVSDWNEYYEWVKSWARHPGFDFAIIPDVIDGTEADNDALIRRWDKTMWHPVYCEGAAVWHLHESLGRLDRMMGHVRTVCLGSSGQYATPGTEAWWRRMAAAMSVACDKDGRPRCRLHGLRMLDPHIFGRLPLRSADSCNAAINGGSISRFGQYCPPSKAARSTVIADRIEAAQSAPVWRQIEDQAVLCFMDIMPTKRSEADHAMQAKPEALRE